MKITGKITGKIGSVPFEATIKRCMDRWFWAIALFGEATSTLKDRKEDAESELLEFLESCGAVIESREGL